MMHSELMRSFPGEVKIYFMPVARFILCSNTVRLTFLVRVRQHNPVLLNLNQKIRPGLQFLVS